MDSSGTFAGSYNKALASSALIISFREERIEGLIVVRSKTTLSALMVFANDFISKKVEEPCFSTCWFSGITTFRSGSGG